MIIALDNIRSAYNVGSIIRTCETFGIKKIILGGITPNPYENPKVIKTSLGAEKSIEFTAVGNLYDYLCESNKSIISLETNNKATDLSKFQSKTSDYVLVVGNEVSGVEKDILKISDHILFIPMRGNKESLNVSVATGIACFYLTLP